MSQLTSGVDFGSSCWKDSLEKTADMGIWHS